MKQRISFIAILVFYSVFVGAQEVDFRTNRAKKYDLTTELGWRTKMAPLFAKAMAYDGGEYGEGVLSRYSFLQSRRIALPFVSGEEPRAALEIVTTLSTGDTLAFVGTHFAHEEDFGREMQAHRINEVLSENRYPTILAGDLNAVPGSKAINILEEVWTATYDKAAPAFTYPSDAPSMKIDYVFFYPEHRWRVLKTCVIQNTIASDHCAYLVSLELLD